MEGKEGGGLKNASNQFFEKKCCIMSINKKMCVNVKTQHTQNRFVNLSNVDTGGVIWRPKKYEM